ncbi:serine carboxypeptidase-like 35 [Wolffia australiana]
MAGLQRFSLVLLVLVCAIGAAGREEEEDRVVGLPGQPAAGFKHYAGYVEVRPGAGKALFYWFFEADEAPEKKPLLLWLNGGPGCSSVAYGAAQELGPFLVYSRGLKLNPYAWNKAANLLFLEAPVGVGYSYTNRTADFKELGDQVAAEDSHAFLLNWFKKYPRFKARPFYIAGESYAGHYVPQLANLIYERNRRGSRDSYINFKGFMIGNAVINDETDIQGMVDYAWSHAIISDKVYHAFRRTCVGISGNGSSAACEAAMKAFMRGYDGIDIYSIYSPLCLSASHSAMPVKTNKPHHFWRNKPISSRAGYDPCAEDYVEKYFNRDDVQRALHANVTRLRYAYSSCSNVIDQWKDSADTVLPIIRKLMNAGLRVWIYSGDTDGRVPVTSTRYSINKMELSLKEDWRAWFHKKQVAGWVVEYKEGLTFATVRGAGHQVPAFAPDRSLSLLSHFLAGDRLPSSSPR